LPSNIHVTSDLKGAPVAGTVSVTDLKPPPATAVVVIVELFGAGPGLYFDFVRFTFHTPVGSWADAVDAMARAQTNATPTTTTRDGIRMEGPPGRDGLKLQSIHPE
jgi:hypothetical protein